MYTDEKQFPITWDIGKKIFEIISDFSDDEILAFSEECKMATNENCPWICHLIGNGFNFEYECKARNILKRRK